ncbi:MAG TPA: hypothetical protein VJ486_05245 [Geothrix sp.]|nr:hypothetical protein [Geothrix sp.]
MNSPILGLLVASAACASFAQQGTQVRRPAIEVQKPVVQRAYLDDGDGNMVEIVSEGSMRGFVPALRKGERTSLGILNYWFLGEGWESDKYRLLKQKLVERYLHEIAFSKEFAPLNPENPANTGFQFQISTLIRTGEKSDLTDSDIRYALVDALGSQGDGRWDASTLNVVFLSPRLVCHLGSLHTGPDFIGYLSSLETEKGTMHYLVVGCTGDLSPICESTVRGILLHATKCIE